MPIQRCVLIAAILFVGCGKDRPAAPSVPSRETLVRANFSVRSRGVTSVTFSTTRSGTVSVVADWTDPRNDIDLALVNPPCDPAGSLSGCVVFGFDTNKVGKPAQIVVALGASTYRAVILNAGPGDEGGVLNVYLD